MFYFTFYGMMIVAATPNLDGATTVSSAFSGLWNLFSCFIVPCTVGNSFLASTFIFVVVKRASLTNFFCLISWKITRGYQCGGDGTIGQINPVAWTMYGLLVSQYGDVTEKLDGAEATVKEFVRRFFGYKHDFLGIVAFVNVVFAVAFSLFFALQIRTFNFQKRQNKLASLLCWKNN
ncbi:hypothetical protein TorRG33x02_166990 [Trema orientale]|uniref:Uncharacterized protein n=1 Tax=Trema orientale TaxID=63057 RepID=A0A2P5EPN3_TREOI|nr:hypothetical protein TorRG33x02_166990 [Trema orientale]